MPSPTLVKQTIARSQNEVAEKLSDLINRNDIETDSIVDVEITRFGTNQFLILAIYLGYWMLGALAGLKASVARALGMSRTAADDLGLASSAARLLGGVRSVPDDLGLAVSITRASTFGCVVEALVGPAAAVSEVWMNFNPAQLIGLDLALLADRTGGIARVLTPGDGLVCDVYFEHTGSP